MLINYGDYECIISTSFPSDKGQSLPIASQHTCRCRRSTRNRPFVRQLRFVRSGLGGVSRASDYACRALRGSVAVPDERRMRFRIGVNLGDVSRNCMKLKVYPCRVQNGYLSPKLQKPTMSAVGRSEAAQNWRARRCPVCDARADVNCAEVNGCFWPNAAFALRSWLRTGLG